MLESRFKSETKSRIRELFYEVEIVDIHSGNPKSFPDTIVLGPNGKWAALEFKNEADAPRQPNQQYYVDKLNLIGYASFIYPEIVEGVLDDLERLFAS